MRDTPSRLWLATLAALAISIPGRIAAQTVWVEGEKPARSAMSRHPWYDSVKKDQLSGHEWISHFDENKEGVVSYNVEIPKSAHYAFWIRANPTQAKLDYKLDNGKATPIDLETGLIDTVNLAADGKPDLRFIAWKKVGELDLKQGRHTLAFRTYSGPQHHGAIDCIVFTTEPFLPRGTRKPGQDVAAGAAGTWPFLPERDTFAPDALLDLRSLNEKTAGQAGFVKLTPDGNDFLLGDGSPVRFWAVTTYVQRDRSADDLAHHARFLAKRGVNMVRYHGRIESNEKSPKLNDIDPKAIDEAWKLVAAMKKEGIYTTLSPYWAVDLKHVPASWGIEGWPEDQQALGLLFFNPRLQEGYKAWLKALLTPKNPYTGIPLSQDPALAIIQIQNEDSLLFWSQQTIKGKQRELLGRQFAAWLQKKYGSLPKALAAWNDAKLPEDAPEKGVVGLHIIWFSTQPASGGLKLRLDDELEFLGQTMHGFNAEIARYLREDLGCKQLVNAGNWKTADTLRLDDVERWSYTANQVIAVNRYYGGVHLGPSAGYRIDPGDRFTDPSALKDPRNLPVSLRQVAGHPMMITETHWVPPTSYQAEAPFLVAAYQSLSGVDVTYWFGTNETEWAAQDRSDFDSASRAKWQVATPTMMGQFPAAALMFRKGYVAAADPVVDEHRALADLWGRVPPIIAEDPGYDPNRDLGTSARRTAQNGPIDPLAFLVGPVRVTFGSDPSRTRVGDLSQFIDRANKRVTSATKQLVWDYGRGLCTLDAPAAQGATGFLKAVGTIKLSTLTIDCGNEYAAVLAVSLDGKPLASTAKLLVQVGTRARPTGWRDHPLKFAPDKGQAEVQGFQIDDTGTMPWAVADAKIGVSIKNPSLKKAALLDINGNRRASVPLTSSPDGVALTIPRDALYVILSAE